MRVHVIESKSLVFNEVYIYITLILPYICVCVFLLRNWTKYLLSQMFKLSHYLKPISKRLCAGTCIPKYTHTRMQV